MYVHYVHDNHLWTVFFVGFKFLFLPNVLMSSVNDAFTISRRQPVSLIKKSVVGPADVKSLLSSQGDGCLFGHIAGLDPS